MTNQTSVNVHLGFTLNTGNFQSLRIDVGIEDWRREGETMDEAFDRVYNYVEQKLNEKLIEAKEELNGQG